MDRVQTLLPLLDDLRAPLAIHHAKHETVLPMQNASILAAALESLDKPHELHVYDSEAHLLTGADRELAINRDVQWFRRAAGPRPAREGNAEGR